MKKTFYFSKEEIRILRLAIDNEVQRYIYADMLESKEEEEVYTKALKKLCKKFNNGKIQNE